MATKKTVSHKKSSKQFNWKVLLIAIVLGVGLVGYKIYAGMLTKPSINKIVSNGLDAEEAAFLQKSINKDKPASVGTAPAPVVKVTVQIPGSDKEVTSNVVLNKKDETDAQDNVTNSIAEQIKTEVLAKGIVTNSEGTVVGGGFKTTNEVNGAARVGDAITNSGTPGAGSSSSSGGTCSTAGSPVLVGTWVSTGHVFEKDGVVDSSQRECVQCGADGKYETSKDKVMSCSAAFQLGYPMVLPSGGGQVYTGKDIPVKPCFIKSGGGFVQVGTGYSADNSVCTPDGNMTSLSAKTDTGKSLADELMSGYCSAIKSGQISKDGKCQPTAPVVTSNPSSNTPLATTEACVPPLVKTADGKCHSQSFLDAQKAAEAKAKSAAETARLAEAYKDSNCGGKFNNKTEKCVPIVGSIQSASGQKYAIVGINSGITAVTYVSGAPASALTKATNSVILNSTFSKGSDCDAALKSMGTGYSCEPVAGGNYYKIQKTYLNYVFGNGNSNSGTVENQNVDTTVIYRNKVGSNGLAETALGQCQDDLVTGYECVPNGFDGYKLVKTAVVTNNQNSANQITTNGQNTEMSAQEKIGKPCTFTSQCGEGNVCDGFWPWAWKCTPQSTSDISSNNDTSSIQTPQNEDGLVSQQASDPADCKYEPTIKSSWNDKWECPSEWSALQNHSNNQEESPDSTQFVSPERAKNIGVAAAPAGVLAGLACAATGVGIPFIPLCVITGIVGGGSIGAILPIKQISTPQQTIIPEQDPLVISNLQELKSKIISSGTCNETNVDVGIKVVCDSNMSPSFVFCDGGNGQFNSNGECTPASR